MRAIAIVLISILAAVIYGVMHDQVMARVCPEYFTIGLREIFYTHDATLLAFGWGIVGTWWIGLLLGLPLAILARGGDRPRRTVKSLVRPVLILMGATAICAVVAGGIGWLLARCGLESLSSWMAQRVPVDRHAWFIAVGYAQRAGYGIGFVGGVVVLLLVWRSRRKAGLSALGSNFQPPSTATWYRLHISSWFVCLATVCIAILAVMPAHVVQSSPEYESINIDTFYRLEHGWPLTFLGRTRPPWFNGDPSVVVWGLGIDVQEFRPVALFVDIFIAGLAVAAAVAFAEWRGRRRVQRPRFQFSLRALLATFTILSVGVGWYCSELASDRQLRTHLDALGIVNSTGPWPPVNDESLVFGSSKPHSRLPLWFCVLFDGNGSAALGVNEPGPLTLLWHRSTHEHIKYLVDRFPSRVFVKFLRVGTEADWNLITQLTSLEYAGFLDRGSEALAHIEGFTRLKSLELTDSPDTRKITDRDMGRLRSLANLESLGIFNAHMTGEGFSHLQMLAHLRALVISTSGLSEASIEPLSHLPALEYIRVIGSVSPDLAQKLKSRLEQRAVRPIRISIDTPAPAAIPTDSTD